MATSLGQVRWTTNTPAIYVTPSYDYYRSGASMVYSIYLAFAPVSGSNYFGYPIYTDIYLDGVQVVSTTIKNASPSQWSSTMNYCTGNQTVANKASGTTTLTIRIYSGSGNTRDVTYRYSLPVIPGKSTITATDANIGSTSNIIINRLSDLYVHTLTYRFGSLSGTIATQTTSASVGWTVPTTFYAQIPNSKTGTCTITCETFSSGTSIGTNTCTFTVTADATNCTPTITGTVTDSNSTTVALTGSNTKIVKYFSTATCSLTATAKNSATISTKTINGTSGTSLTISNCETTSFVFYCKDSRGYDNHVTVTPTMINYVKLTNNANVVRVTPTGNTVTLTLAGNYFNGSFGSKSNSLTCKYRYKESGGSFGSYTTVTATKSGNTYSYSTTISGFAYNKSYVLEVVVNDELMSVTKTIDVSQGVPVFDWGGNDFTFHVPVTMDSPLGVEYGGTGAASASGALNTFGIKDYIIEYGTSNGWVYQKYNSGLAILYGTASISGTWGAWDSLYYLSGQTPAYPFTFTEIPAVYPTFVSGGTGATSNWPGTYTAGTTTYGNICLYRPTPGANNTAYVLRVMVVGRWK